MHRIPWQHGKTRENFPRLRTKPPWLPNVSIHDPIAFTSYRIARQTVTILLLCVALGTFPDPGTIMAGEPRTSHKRVVIDKTHQILRGYEGDRLVFQSRISTGKGNSTPSGRFHVRGKERMHYSRRYDNAPMPFSIHLRGHYFIHGFSFVPDYPASHGCIRLPLRNGNPARRFYQWVDIGTPVIIRGEWHGRLR